MKSNYLFQPQDDSIKCNFKRISFCFSFLILMMFTVFICSCSQESLLNSESEQKSLGVREPSEELPTLCIGCGCSQDFQNCLNGGDTHGCWDLWEEEIDRDCCKDLRAQCHQCSAGIICIRFTFLGVANPPSDFYAITYPISSSDSLLLVPYWEQVEKFLDGEQLSDEDFELLDQDRIQ